MPDAADTSVALPPAAPDWGRQAEELHCPLCEYNLRGLTNPVCPECGYRFEWSELLDAGRRKHPYLFEYHAGRNVWSFRKTAAGGLRPGRFWAALSPAMFPRPRRLMVYCALTALAGLVGVASLYAAEWARMTAEIRSMYTLMAKTGGGNRTTYFNPFTNTSVSSPTGTPPPPLTVPLYFLWDATGAGYLVAWAFACSWPWLKFLALLVFRISMRRARINPAHVLRCVVYAGDSILWAGLAVFVLSATAAGMTLSGAGRPELLRVVVPWVAAACVPVWGAYRLGVAYRTYLRFDRPWATVLASQFIVLLVWVNLLVIPSWLHR